MLPIQHLELAGLSTCIVGPGDAPLTVVLLHGFGAPGDDLVGLASYLRAPARFVFPAAPLELSAADPADAASAARAWWMLDLARLEAEMRAGTARDRRAEVPEGLPPARQQMLRLLDQVKTQLGVDDRHLVIGGFSQGAMLALDVALHREVAPAAVIAMSTTLLAEGEWQPRMTRLAGVPVLLSHGRHDPLLPFAIAEVVRDKLRAAGAAVDWHAFPGGHEIPPAVLAAAGALLTRLAAT